MTQDPHIDPADLYLFHRGELGDERIRRHLESCPTCQAELAMAADFDGTSDLPVSDVQSERLRAEVLGATASTTPRRSPAPRGIWLPRVVLAAGVAFMAFGVWRLAPLLQDRPSGMTPSGQVRAPEGEEWSLEAIAHEDFLELRWDQDRRVTLRIHDAAGQVVHQMAATGTLARVPQTLLDELRAAHGALFAQLVLEDGTLSPVVGLTP